jgi:hypothetical protein
VRIFRIASTLASLPLLAATAALATVNHGNFLGTSVDFNAVSETTLSADPEPLWNAPTLAGSGDQLAFFPPNFTSACSLALGATDTTASSLTTEIVAHTGTSIDTIMLAENGDVTLTKFPPFGDPNTNASAALSGNVTVTEVNGSPVTPVVIPFTGTFTPQSSFALPTDFGTKLWTGSITINVSAAVTGASKAVLTLNNTLNANCGAGNTSAKIQKKVVSGPSVAILVNPIECDLEIDKTCCVTQPVLPDLDSCDGQLESLLLEYTGDKCSSSSNQQGGHFECHGRHTIGEDAELQVLTPGVVATPTTDLDYGEVVELTHVNGVFGQKTKLKVSDDWFRRQFLKIDTSCGRAIACGDQFGAFKVVGLESTLGGIVDCNTPPPPPECAPSGDPVGTSCDEKLVDMVLEYQGQACQVPLPNPQNGEAKCAGDATGATNVGVVYAGKFGNAHQVSPASGINDGDRIRVTSTLQSGGLFPNQKLLITTSSGVVQTVEFHVSCSQPLFLGDQFGSFKLVEFTTKAGTSVALGSGDPGPFDACEVPLAPPGPHCTSDVRGLTLVYIGDYLGLGCTVSNPQGGYGTCSGVADPGDPVTVTPGTGLTAQPTDQIQFGDLVTLTSSTTSHLDLPALSNVTVSGDGGSQSIQIKTSCEKPLSLGDRFGSFVVFGMDREEDGPISLGGNIQYQYTVTNPNTSTVDNVEVTDDLLGVIASGVSIPASQSQTFIKTATLFGTTTNVATATGDVDGDICAPGTDQVTVSVLAPPQGAFSCSAPITELTLIWNGSQTVDVKVWSGAPNLSTLLGTFDDVDTGEAVNATGLGGTTPTLEIFDSTGTTLIGKSQFDLTCSDQSMNSLEDCGKNNGNLKLNYSTLNNDWLLEGMVDSDEELACTPGLVPNPPACGFGPELMVVMPGLLWWYRRRLRKES